MNIDTVLAPRTGLAFQLAKADRFRIEDLEGKQVSDLVLFATDDPTERLSQANTRKLNGTWLLTKESCLYSTMCRPLARIAEDTVGRHDLQSSCCSPYDYPLRFGAEGHPSCLAILAETLARYNIPEYLIPDPFNVFMQTTVDPNSGAIEVHAPRSGPGDFIEFELLTDCIVGLTVCPQDMNECNGRMITPLRLRTIVRGDDTALAGASAS